MKAYIMESKRKIDPFNEHPCDCLIKNEPLATLQKKVFSDLGLETVFIPNTYQLDDPDEHLVFDDNLYFTSELLEEFIARSRKRRSDTTCALKSGITTLRTVVAVQKVKVFQNHIEYGLHYLPEKRFRGKCHPLVIEPDQFSASIMMPKHLCGSEEYSIPITERFIVQINHWANLWAANIVSLLAEGARIQKASKIKIGILALKARSLNKWKILCQLNRVGRNCEIHPTAYIEGSTIGDNVTVGAGTIIRESVVGSGVFIGNGVVIEESVIGEKSTILSGHILFSVLYPGTFTVAQFISASLIGRDTFIGSNVTLTDFRLDGRNVTVMREGTEVNTKNTFLGCCLGHRVYLGSGCTVAPGRAIPQNMRIAPDKDRVISISNSIQGVPGFRLINNKKLHAKD